MKLQDTTQCMSKILVCIFGKLESVPIKYGVRAQLVAEYPLSKLSMCTYGKRILPWRNRWLDSCRQIANRPLQRGSLLIDTRVWAVLMSSSGWGVYILRRNLLNETGCNLAANVDDGSRPDNEIWSSLSHRRRQLMRRFLGNAHHVCLFPPSIVRFTSIFREPTCFDLKPHIYTTP